LRLTQETNQVTRLPTFSLLTHAATVILQMARTSTDIRSTVTGRAARNTGRRQGHGPVTRERSMKLMHETVTVWTQGAVPTCLLWGGVRYTVTDTPTALYDYIAEAPTHPL